MQALEFGGTVLLTSLCSPHFLCHETPEVAFSFGTFVRSCQPKARQLLPPDMVQEIGWIVDDSIEVRQQQKLLESNIGQTILDEKTFETLCKSAAKANPRQIKKEDKLKRIWFEELELEGKGEAEGEQLSTVANKVADEWKEVREDATSKAKSQD